MPELAFVSGRIMAIEDAVVPIEDRGYQFGDAVYEFIASYGGRLFQADAHLDRLERSMAALDFPSLARDRLRGDIRRLYDRAQLERAGLYIQVSRGVAPRNHAFSADLTPQVVMTVRRLKEIPPALLARGAAVITVADLRWGRCDIKTVQLLANVLAKQRALSSGADDAVFVAGDGTVREGTSSNLFMVQKGRVLTHPLTVHILPGITRAVVIELCRQEHLTCEERFFDRDALCAADEIFLTGTTTEVLPVVSVDGRNIADGKVGPVARRLRQALRRRAAGD